MQTNAKFIVASQFNDLYLAQAQIIPISRTTAPKAPVLHTFELICAAVDALYIPNLLLCTEMGKVEGMQILVCTTAYVDTCPSTRQPKERGIMEQKVLNAFKHAELKSDSNAYKHYHEDVELVCVYRGEYQWELNAKDSYETSKKNI